MWRFPQLICIISVWVGTSCSSANDYRIRRDRNSTKSSSNQTLRLSRFPATLSLNPLSSTAVMFSAHPTFTGIFFQFVTYSLITSPQQTFLGARTSAKTR